MSKFSLNLRKCTSMSQHWQGTNYYSWGAHWRWFRWRPCGVLWTDSQRPRLNSGLSCWYHDDAELSYPTAETELEVMADTVMPMTPWKCEEKSACGSYEFAFGFLLGDPRHGFCLWVWETALHLHSWGWVRIWVWCFQRRDRWWTPFIVYLYYLISWCHSSSDHILVKIQSKVIVFVLILLLFLPWLIFPW